MATMANDFSAQLRAAFIEDTPQEQEATDTYGQLARLITSITGIAEPGREDKLNDLGLTSLNLIELTIKAEEKFKIPFEEATAAAFETVGDIAAYIDTRRLQ